MTVGRKAKTDTPVDWKVSIPSTVVAPVELKMQDPVTHKVRYGARSKLVTRLLKRWLEVGDGIFEDNQV